MAKQKQYAPEVQRLVARYQRKGLTFLRYNSKTLVSLDVDNRCPKAEAGNMCAYCYRRDLETAKRLKPCTYHNGGYSDEMLRELRAFCRELRTIAPRLRSIRTFSLSDYRPRDAWFWQNVWSTIRKAGLRVHVITKQFDSVPDIAPHVDCVQVSIDSLEARNWVPAELLRRKYNNVVVRCVVLCDADLGIVKNADLITVYHGNKIRDDAGNETIRTYRTSGNSHKVLCRNLEKTLRKKTCCVTGHCDDCGKCWYPKRLRRKS